MYFVRLDSNKTNGETLEIVTFDFLFLKSAKITEKPGSSIKTEKGLKSLHCN